MGVTFLVIGLIAGTLIGFFIGKSKSQQEILSTRSKITEKEILLNQIQIQVSDLKRSIEKQSQLSIKQLEDLKGAEIQLAKKTSELENLNKRFTEFKNESSDLQKQLKTEFKNIANEIVKEQSKDFSNHNQNLLKPFKTQLETFEKAIHEQLKDNIQRATSFKEQIEQLKSLNLQISQEANNLTNALKGDNKFQGNWGELILERVLENSGLENGSEYKTQVSLTNAEEDRIQPDAVVYLPDNKHIIIDSKVSLVSYEQYVNCTNDIKREQHLKSHLISVFIN